MAKYKKTLTIKIVPPFLDEEPQPVDDPERILSTEDIITGKHFQRGIVTGTERPYLTIRNSIFTQNYFVECKFKSAQVSDVRFENCDLSNASFAGGSFHRVEFISCKLLGTNFSETTMTNVLFKACNAHYINLSISKLTQVKLDHCDLKNGYLNENKLKDILFDSCLFIETDLSHTSLKGIDLRTSRLEGLQLNVADLKGAIVSSLQALDLLPLLGVIIED